MLRCVEQDVSNISYMHQNQKIKIKNMKIDTPIWMAADFECMNALVESKNNFMDKMFVSKPVAIDYDIVENPDYDNLNLEKDGYIKYFVEHCVEWFSNEMLEIEGYSEDTFKKEIETNLDTIPKNYDENTCWLCEKKLDLKMVKKIQLLKTIAIY